MTRSMRKRDSQTFQKLFCLIEFRKKLFLFLKSLGVNATAAAVQLHWMFQVQHFMIDEILDCIEWHVGTIKDPTDHDGVVRRIIVAEALTRRMTAPRHQRTRE